MDKLKEKLLILLMFLPVWMYGQVSQLIVTGHVYSELDGELIGVHVLEVDKNNRNISATVTDFNGDFSLEIKNPSNSIKFVYVGYKAVQLPIGEKRKFSVKMDENTLLGEVVVQAKTMHSDGTIPIPQREISGAVQKINTKEFHGLSVASIDDALQGRIAGLDIMSNSGNLGAGSTLRIRGTSSINSKAEPLIVLNDVPFESNLANFDFASATEEQFANLMCINPDDIEEITVLKDGAAAAIWGSKAANGVIMIKTKRGVKGPTKVQYSYRFSGKKQPKGLNMLDGDEYTMMIKQAYFNAGNVKGAGMPEFNYDPTFSEYYQFNNNTDWVAAITQYGFTNDHNLNISGGGEKATFRVSLGYYDETGTVIKQELKRYTTRMNLEYQVSDRIRFTSELAITNANNHKNLAYDNSDGNNTENLLSLAYRKMPNVSIYDKDQNGNNLGTFYVISRNSSLESSQKELLNPVALAHLAKNDDNQIKITPKLSLRYDILDPHKGILRFNSYVTFDFDNRDVSRFLPKEQVSDFSSTDYRTNQGYVWESEALAIHSDQNMLWVPKLGEKHNLSLYASWQLSTTDTKNQGFKHYGLPGSGITDPTVASFDDESKTEATQQKTVGLLGRIHYTLLGRYVLDMSIRRDGDSRFGPSYRWGNFPAVSGKWILSDEAFMKSMEKWLSEFGLRAGYGVTGNPPDKNYLYFCRYNAYGSGYIDFSTIKQASVQLTDLKWEQSASTNLGFDLSLFDHKCSMDFNVYKKRTKGLLLKDYHIPSSTGFGYVSYINAGTLDNTGWEFNFSTNKLIKVNQWTFDLNFNLSNFINKMVSMNPSFLREYNKEFNYDSPNYQYLSRIQEGDALGSIYGFRYKGVYQYDKYEPGQTGTSPYVRDAEGNIILDGNGKAIPIYFAYGILQGDNRFRGGDAIYEDINNDGTIDELDIVYLGNSNPKVNGGFGATARYKRFSVNAFFTFRYGNKILNEARMRAEDMRTDNNQSIAVAWRWKKDGDLSEIPRALHGKGYNSLGSDRYVEDGSFLRFKYLTFNYDFDQKLIKQMKMNQLSLYLTLNNIITFTKYTGVDPEIPQNMNPGNGLVGVCTDKNKTPRAQYFTLGATLGF